MIPKCCCNPAACNYVDDAFTRADETPVASPWSKLTTSGGAGTDWNLASNVLDAVGAATYKHNTVWPGGASDARHASVRFKLPTGTADNTRVEILQGIEPDAFLGQPYDWFTAWVNYHSTDCCYISANAFYHGLGYGGGTGPGITNSVQIPDGELTLEEWHTLEICLIPDSGSYGYENYELTICKLTLANGNVYSCQQLSNTGQTIGDEGGLKTNVAVKFDDFKETYYRNSPSGSNKTCPWCHTPCAISSDAFTTDDACKWDVISGSYSVGSGLMTLGASPSKIQFHIFHPGLKTTHRVAVDVQDNAVESKVFIGNGYAKLTYAAGLRTLTLYDNDDNVLDTDVQTVSVTSDSSLYMALTLCYSRGVISCTVTGRGESLCVDSAIAETTDGYWAALGGNNGAVFDNFVFRKTYDATAPADLDCGGCPSCPLVCTDCCDSPVETQYIVDLGAGGWTYGDECATPGSSCNACEDANGEFLLVHGGGSDCNWYYEDRDNCDFPCVTGFFGNPGDPPIFGIILQLGGTPGNCRWTVIVFMSKSVGTATFDCTGAGADTTVTYQSDYLDSTADCQTMPVTLTRISEAGDCPCTGSLPATITVEAA